MAITEEEFKKALPDKMKKVVNPEMLERINQLLDDPDLHEVYRENLLSYTSVMKSGRFKTMDYVKAVKYVTHKLMGSTNQEAFIKVFPERYQGLLERGYVPKDIASYISSYNNSKLVSSIMEQTIIPSWVLNQDLYQKAINVQADLMMNATSEKVRSDASAHLLNHLKPPEVQKVELDIGMKEHSSLDAIREATMALVAQQRLALQAGAVNAKEVAEYKIIQAKEVADD